MKVVIFSPISVTSRIARDTHSIVLELTRRGHRFVIIDSALKETRGENFNFGKNSIVLRSDSAEVRAALKEADVICYQCGTDFELHGGIFPFVLEYPGLTIVNGEPLELERKVEQGNGQEDQPYLHWLSSMVSSTMPNFELEINMDVLEERLWHEIGTKLQSDATRRIADRLIELFPDDIPPSVIDEIGDSLNGLFGIEYQ